MVVQVRYVVFFAIIAVLLNGDCCLHAQEKSDTVSFGAFRNATAFAVDPQGNFYVIDDGTSQLIKMSSDGAVVRSIGGYGWTQPTFDRPRDIVAPNGLDIYIADYGNHRIVRYDRNLNFVSSLPPNSDERAEREFGYPQGVALSLFGDMFIADGENRRVVKYVRNSLERTFGGVEGGKGQLHAPKRVRVSDQNRVYVQDDNVIIVYDIFGNYVTTIGERFFINLINFSVDHDTLYILDSASVYRYMPQGKLDAVDVSRALTNMEKVENAVDIAVERGRLFMLTPHAIVAQPVKVKSDE